MTGSRFRRPSHLHKILDRFHTNTAEGLWTGLRTFLRPFRGVSKHFLSGYIAIHEFHVNLRCISVAFIASLVRLHYCYR